MRYLVRGRVRVRARVGVRGGARVGVGVRVRVRGGARVGVGVRVRVRVRVADAVLALPQAGVAVKDLARRVLFNQPHRVARAVLMHHLVRDRGRVSTRVHFYPVPNPAPNHVLMHRLGTGRGGGGGRVRVRLE